MEWCPTSAEHLQDQAAEQISDPAEEVDKQIHRPQQNDHDGVDATKVIAQGCLAAVPPKDSEANGVVDNPKS